MLSKEQLSSKCSVLNAVTVQSEAAHVELVVFVVAVIALLLNRNE